MNKLDLKSYKGTRDIYPEDMRLRRYIFDTWREAVEACGYEEYDAPMVEPFELYAAKTGEEIVNEQTYTFIDRGERKVAIRPEMTPSIARMVAARRQEMAYPARLYSIANFMRYEKPQKGREREFWQLNYDIFGADSIDADAEIIAIGAAIMEKFGATPEMYTIMINDRQLIDYIMREYLSLNEEKALSMVKLFDKKDKISAEAFNEMATEIIGEAGLGKVQELLNIKSLDDVPAEIAESGKLDDIKKVFGRLRDDNVSYGVKNIVFDITLMRGFDYYTGIVFEVFDNNPENNRAMFGGGRYNGLVGLFGVEDLPVVGCAPGETTTMEFLKAWNLVPELKPTTDLVVVKVGDAEVAELVAELRGLGVNVAVDFTGRKLEKVIKSADKLGVGWIAFVNEKDLASDEVNLKNLKTGKKYEFTADQTSKIAETVL